jgi:hypothetical protein
MWGVWEGERTVQVIPCDGEGYMLKPHRFYELCSCRPEIVEIGGDGRPIIIHNEVH